LPLGQRGQIRDDRGVEALQKLTHDILSPFVVLLL
jgi:hypothetical protein